ncbi:MAG: hypothetical protein E2O53_09065, partial [Gammaproteobacteria bacterium]
MIVRNKSSPFAHCECHINGTPILVAGALLLAGGLQTLQAASTAIAVPFSVVILLMMVGLSKSLWQTETR